MSHDRDTLKSNVRWLLAGLTALVYWQVSSHSFINYDDPLFVTANPHVYTGVTLANLKWAFTTLTGDATSYQPLVWLTHQLDCELFGVEPGPQHLTNLWLPAWEAMCSALPVVYTNYSAHGEFLSRGQAGLPVGGILQPEPKNCICRMVANVPQAVEAVRRLYFDRALARQLGTNGRAFVQQFTIDTQVEAWHRTFTQLVHPTPLVPQPAPETLST